MSTEAATNVVKILHFAHMTLYGSITYAKCDAKLFSSDFIIIFDKRDDFAVQIALGDISSDILDDTLSDTIIQICHNNRKLVSVGMECRALVFCVVDLCLVAI